VDYTTAGNDIKVVEYSALGVQRQPRQPGERPGRVDETIASSVRFHSITAFGADTAGLVVVPRAGTVVVSAVGVDGTGGGPYVGTDWERAEATATAEARSPARRNSLHPFIGSAFRYGLGRRTTTVHRLTLPSRSLS